MSDMITRCIDHLKNAVDKIATTAREIGTSLMHGVDDIRKCLNRTASFSSFPFIFAKKVKNELEHDKPKQEKKYIYEYGKVAY